MAVSSAVGETDEPLESLTLSNGEVVASTAHTNAEDSSDDSDRDRCAGSSGSTSWTAAGFSLAWRTAKTSVSIASGFLRGSDYAKGMLQPETPPEPSAGRSIPHEKKRQ